MKPTRRQFAGAVLVTTTAAACGSKKTELDVSANPPGPGPVSPPPADAAAPPGGTPGGPGRAPPPPAAAPAPPPIPHPELEEVTLVQLRDRLAAKTDTAVSLVEKYTRRIAAMNERGPKLRAVLEVNAQAA